MPRKGRKKSKRKHHGQQNELCAFAHSIEDDLREQRLRQQQRLKEEEKQRKLNEAKDQQGSASNRIITCSYDESDEDDDTDNHKNEVERAENVHWMEHQSNFPRSLLPLIPSFSLSMIHQTFVRMNTHQRTMVRNAWCGKYIMEQMYTYSKASTFYSAGTRWREHQVPDGSYCSWDLSCKYDIPPHACTFDVAMGLKSLPITTRTTIPQHHHEQQQQQPNLPTIASIVQGGLVIYEPGIESGNIRSMNHQLTSARATNANPQVYSIRGPPVQVVHVRPPTEETLYPLVGTISKALYASPFLFQCYAVRPTNETSNYETVVQEYVDSPVHDFSFGKDLVLFAPGRSLSTSPSFSPLFLPLGERLGSLPSSVQQLQVTNFPQSDALRIRLECQSKLVAFGHRNGQISLIDLRQSTRCCGMTNPEDMTKQSSSSSSTSGEAPLGSVTDLAFLQSSNQLVVKRSFGCCQLHDLRYLQGNGHGRGNGIRISSAHRHKRRDRNSSNDASITQEPSLVFTMSPPQDDYHPTLSSNCSGIVVDPTSQRVVISPYISSSTHESNLGFWSLANGTFLGSKCLQSNPFKDIMYTELCPTITPAYESTRNGTKMKGRYKNGLRETNEQDPPVSLSSFGIWLKCGRYSKVSRSNSSTKAGSLHHVTFPGRWNS